MFERCLCWKNILNFHSFHPMKSFVLLPCGSGNRGFTLLVQGINQDRVYENTVNVYKVLMLLYYSELWLMVTFVEKAFVNNIFLCFDYCWWVFNILFVIWKCLDTGKTVLVIRRPWIFIACFFLECVPLPFFFVGAKFFFRLVFLLLLRYRKFVILIISVS